MVYLVDGVKLPYSQATLEAMYSYLDRHGELFWIEVKEKGEWFPNYKVNHCEEAFAWYQDVNLVYLVDGVKLPYSQATLEAMYSYLDRHGELFWIEVKEKGEWFPIGDITLSQDNLPIVIGNSAYQHRGLGKKILSALIELARVKGWKELRVKEIYTYNHASRRCFKSLGFVENGATEKGRSFILELV
ncbi:GNAT family N-acetyltransferase [Streptococcus pneumoniae]|nr:GNAT family N-acetyltransferase [Streptococcus pneumoniae]